MLAFELKLEFKLKLEESDSIDFGVSFVSTSAVAPLPPDGVAVSSARGTAAGVVVSLVLCWLAAAAVVVVVGAKVVVVVVGS